MIALVLSACAVEDWRNADLQLDLRGDVPHDEDRVRVCVDGVGMLEEAVGAGAVAFTGIPRELEAVTVLVSGLDLSFVGGPVTLTLAEPFAEAAWNDCDDCEPCQSPGERAEDAQGSLLLAVRWRP